jgi:hypothetical protein
MGKKTIVLEKYFGINTQDPYEPSDVIYGDMIGQTRGEMSLSQLIKENYPDIIDGSSNEVNKKFKITIEELPGVFDHVIQ